MIRLKDIAESAGVSVMTVSKALRNEPDISDTTKARFVRSQTAPDTCQTIPHGAFARAERSSLA